MSRLSEVLTGAFALKPYLKASWAIQANIAAAVKLLVFIRLVLGCGGSKGLHQKLGPEMGLCVDLCDGHLIHCIIWQSWDSSQKLNA